MFSRRNVISLCVAILSIVGYGFVVFAAAPAGGYLPGSELNPDCAPGDTDCKVVTLTATTTSNFTWMGTGAGQNGASTDNTVFMGIGAGDGATNADYSNFIGTGAGLNAVNADHSNFLGQLAGCNATNADNANFFGYRAGCGATDANNSNFFGNSAGEDAINASFSTFFGDTAGFEAADASYSNFIGAAAGYQALNAARSNFLGYHAGYQATAAADSNFFGYQAGEGATNAQSSFFGGNQAGYNADGANNSILMGYQAGYNASGTPDFLGPTANGFGFGGGAAFFGYRAGYDASGAAQSTFIGTQAGSNATNAIASTFMGFMTGMNATNSYGTIMIGALSGIGASNADTSTFIGNNSGNAATNARDSVFVGTGTGEGATNASQVLFLGNGAGKQATDAIGSVFLGASSGRMAVNAANSIFIGRSAGYQDPVANDLNLVSYTGLSGGTFSVGEEVVVLESGTSFTIVKLLPGSLVVNNVNLTFNPGETLVGDNGATATITGYTLGSASILIGSGSGTGGYKNSIALGTSAYNTADNQLMIGSGNYPINDMVIQGTGFTSCTVDTMTGAGISCSSDERLKKDVADLGTNTIENLLKVRTVNYKWMTGDTDNHIGFLAQDLQKYYPELVSAGPKGYLQVNYAGMTPILVQAVRELDLKISNVEKFMTTGNATFMNELRAWFANQANGIGNFFADTLNAKNKVCIDGVCVTKADFEKLLQMNASQAPAPQNPAPVPDPTPEPEAPSEEQPVEEVSADPQPEPEAPAIEEPAQEPAPQPEAPTSEPAPSPEPAPATSAE